MKNALTLTAVFIVLFAATPGCRNSSLSKLNEPESKCAIELPELGSAAEYVERGNKELTKDNYECGFEDCRKALDLDSQNVDALVCRGYAYKKRQNYELAESDLNEAVRLAPDSLSPVFQRGQLYYEIEQLDKALIDQNRVIELSPAYFHYERRNLRRTERLRKRGQGLYRGDQAKTRNGSLLRKSRQTLPINGKNGFSRSRRN